MGSSSASEIQPVLELTSPRSSIVAEPTVPSASMYPSSEPSACSTVPSESTRANSAPSVERKVSSVRIGSSPCRPRIAALGLAIEPAFSARPHGECAGPSARLSSPASSDLREKDFRAPDLRFAPSGAAGGAAGVAGDAAGGPAKLTRAAGTVVCGG